MQIEPFSFREFGSAELEVAGIRAAKAFLPHGRKKEEAAPLPPPPPTFSETDLHAAERAAFQKGYLEGIEEGKKQAHDNQADIDAQLTQSLQNITAHLAPLFLSYRDIMRSHLGEVPFIAHTIAKKVTGDIVGANAETMISQLATRCIEMMEAEPKLVIVVHQSLCDSLQKKLQNMSASHLGAREISVVGKEDMAISDCKIEWKNGAMERNTEHLWQQIEKAVGAMKENNERTAEMLCNQLEPQIIADITTPTAPEHPEGE